jgi:hypothetical protein
MNEAGIARRQLVSVGLDNLDPVPSDLSATNAYKGTAGGLSDVVGSDHPEVVSGLDNPGVFG